MSQSATIAGKLLDKRLFVIAKSIQKLRPESEHVSAPWGGEVSRGTTSVSGEMEDRWRRRRSAGAIEVEMSQRCQYREAVWQREVVGVSGSLRRMQV